MDKYLGSLHLLVEIILRLASHCLQEVSSGISLPAQVKVKVTQSCLTLCDPVDDTVHGILQATTLKWVAFPFSRDLPNLGIETVSPALQEDSLPTELSRKPYLPKVA